MKLRNIIFAFAAFAGLVSCVKDDLSTSEGMTVFKAVYSDAPTSKTVLSGLTPFWSPSDRISIYDGKNNEFVYNGKSAAASASFSGTLAGKPRQNYLAAYPYREDLSFSFMGMTVYDMILPQQQTAVENSYDPQAALAVAYAEGKTLGFKNICSLIKFKVVSEGVTSVTLVPNDDTKVLAGTLNVTIGTELQLTITEKQNTVELKGEFKKDGIYYITTLPVSLENGFTVLLNGNIRSFVTDVPVNLARSGLVDLGSLSLDPSESQTPENPGGNDNVSSPWGIPGEHNGWNVDEPTPMYELAAYYVAYDVPAGASSGFKFKNGDTWLGCGGAAALDTWTRIVGEGGSNITFTAASDAKYDIYLSKDEKSFYITLAGSPAPSPAETPEVKTGVTVAGTFNGWNTGANPMTGEGDYYVLKGFKAAAVSSSDPTDIGFKVVLTNADGEVFWFGAAQSDLAVSQWHALDMSGGNIVISGDSNADYDLYVNGDGSHFCVVPAGSPMPSSGGGSDQPENPGTGGVTDGTVYLKPNANWLEAGARFAVYFFEDPANIWVDMVQDEESGVFKCAVPEGYSNMIFCRMNPGTVDNNWDNKWSQTADLKVPVDDNVCFVLTDGSWTEGGWTTYPPVIVEPENPGTGGDEPSASCRLIVKVSKSIDWYDKYIYSWVDNQPILAQWPGVKMNWDKEDGEYYVYYYDFLSSYDGKEINYIINNGSGGGGNQTIDLAVTLNGAETVVTIEPSLLQ